MTKVVQIDQIKYQLRANCTAIVTDNRDLPLAHVHIPATITHDGQTYPVVAVGQNAFHLNRAITSVTFASDSSVASFDERAFQNTQITTLEIPSSLTSLHADTFRHTPSLTRIVLKGGDSFVLRQLSDARAKQDPLLFTKDGTTLLFVPRNRTKPLPLADPLRAVGAYACEGCSRLPGLTIPGAVSVLGAGALSGLAIAELTIPATVLFFGDGFLRNCGALAKVAFAANGVQYPIPRSAFAQTALRHVVLPPHITRISPRAFAKTESLQSVTFAPKSRLASIGADAFWCSSIETLEIPDSLTDVAPANFFGCERLAAFAIGGGNAHYAWDRDVLWGHGRTVLLFAKRTIEALVIPAAVEVIGANAFCFCRRLRSVRFEDGSQLRYIGGYAFFGTALSAVSIPDGVTAIAENAFANCARLADVRFGAASQLAELGRRAFAATALRYFDGPARLAKLGAALFANARVETVVLPRGVDALPPLLFFGCRALQYVISDNPGAVTAAEGAFDGASEALAIHKHNPERFRGARAGAVRGGEPPGVRRQRAEARERAPTRPRTLSEATVPDERARVLHWPPREGTFANVYKGEHVRTREVSAMKELKSTNDDKLIRECETLLSMVHPGVIGLIGVVLPSAKTNGKIITEFMPNGSLNDQIQAEEYSERTPTLKVKIAVGVAETMRYIHGRNVIHRDLKPHNILLDEDFEPRVADFGTARSLDYTMTATGPAGTAYYMAPELVEASDCTRAVDVYSYAITLWETLTGISMGRHCADAAHATPWAFLNSVKQGRRPRTSGEGIDLQAWVVRLLERCWSANPAERPSFEAILVEFRSRGFALLPDVDVPAVEEYLGKIERFDES